MASPSPAVKIASKTNSSKTGRLSSATSKTDRTTQEQQAQQPLKMASKTNSSKTGRLSSATSKTDRTTQERQSQQSQGEDNGDVRSRAPDGFHELLQKLARAVILARPAHVYRFLADTLDVGLAQRTFDDIMYRCHLMRSRQLRATESCRLLSSFVGQSPFAMEAGEDQFADGPIPDDEPRRPALDRYRDYAGIGVFDMTCCELMADVAVTPAAPPPAEPPQSPKTPASSQPQKISFDRGPIPEYQLAEPALDRYREYAGIEPFEFDAECIEHSPLCRSLTSTYNSNYNNNNILLLLLLQLLLLVVVVVVVVVVVLPAMLIKRDIRP